MARIELPFQRDRMQEEMLADGRLVVQPGTNLWRIARRVYGRGTRYTVIECRRSALILINRREFSWPIRSNDFEVRARLSRWSKPILLRRIQA